MTEATPLEQQHRESREEPLLDQLLREAVPEIKLALGDLIDRENSRAIPDRYTRFLPETVLAVTLRPDAARAIEPMAAELEAELTESVLRHGSLYDREYRVRLKEAGAQGAPLFRVAKEVVKAGEAPAPSLAERATSTPQPLVPHAEDRTEHAPAAGGETVAVPPPRPAPSLPAMDPDATRLDGLEPPPPAEGWTAGAFRLVVEDDDGAEKESFDIPSPAATVGRHTDNPELRSDLMLTGAQQVSRRQLALVWSPRDGEPGFRVCNLGLNALHVDDREVPGANRKGAWTPGDLPEESTTWVAPGTRMRIGEHGPVLRIDAVEPAEPPRDPDATQFG